MVKVMKKKRVRVRRVGTLISSTITKKQKQNKTKNKTKTSLPMTGQKDIIGKYIRILTGEKRY